LVVFDEFCTSIKIAIPLSYCNGTAVIRFVHRNWKTGRRPDAANDIPIPQLARAAARTAPQVATPGAESAVYDCLVIVASCAEFNGDNGSSQT